MRFKKKKYPVELIDNAFIFCCKMKKSGYYISEFEDFNKLQELHTLIFEMISAYSSDIDNQSCRLFLDIIEFVKKFKKDYQEIKIAVKNNGYDKMYNDLINLSYQKYL